MSRLRVLCTLAAALAAMSFVLCPQSLQAAPLCPLGNGTLHGTYVVSGSGFATNIGQATAVGEVTFDGRGNSNATFTASFNGNIQTITVSGTYSVNADCTGTHVEESSHYFFVATPDGNQTNWIEVDSGVVFSGIIVRLRPLEDTEAKVRDRNTRIAPTNVPGRKTTTKQRIKATAVTRLLPRSS